MKAKDYYEKYAERLLNPESRGHAVIDIADDFTAETLKLVKNRGVKTDKALMAVVNEMNDKWNALARMLPVQILKHNGWRDYILPFLNTAQKENPQ